MIVFPAVVEEAAVAALIDLKILLWCSYIKFKNHSQKILKVNYQTYVCKYSSKSKSDIALSSPTYGEIINKSSSSLGYDVTGIIVITWSSAVYCDVSGKNSAILFSGAISNSLSDKVVFAVDRLYLGSLNHLFIPRT